ncbi:aminotransferase family protein-like protein [Xylaria cf. heliscus]|nr:aminotransferase family protein-like protein [Xylaria cf. heliscus]
MTATPLPPAKPLVPFGRAMRHAHFAFSPDYTPLNHGSYGTFPVSVRGAHAALQSEAEAAPDRFIVLEWPTRLRDARAATARLLNCPTDDLVFVPNATTGIDTVLKNIKFRPGDVVLVYEVVYEAVRGGLAWLEETFGIRVEVVPLCIPLPDDDIVDAVVSAARRVNASGTERVRLAVVDTVVSMPGFRVPFERLVPALQAEGALVIVDGAHGIGHVGIDLKTLDPDFFVTNLHKWLFVPRGAAVMYVPQRHQALMRTSLPTSHRFRRQGDDENAFSFIQLFDFTATLDTTNYLTVKAALAFRNEVCGGEAAIKAYCRNLARESGAVVATLFGTEVMDAAGSCMRECNFANVRLPLAVSESGEPGTIRPRDAPKVCMWFKATGVKEDGTYLQTCFYRGAFWWRLSAMVYLEVDDFRKGAHVLLGLCQRAAKGEFLEDAK